MANVFAQAEALAFGKTADEVRAEGDAGLARAAPDLRGQPSDQHDPRRAPHARDARCARRALRAQRLHAGRRLGRSTPSTSGASSSGRRSRSGSSPSSRAPTSRRSGTTARRTPSSGATAGSDGRPPAAEGAGPHVFHDRPRAAVRGVALRARDADAATRRACPTSTARRASPRSSSILRAEGMKSFCVHPAHLAAPPSGRPQLRQPRPRTPSPSADVEFLQAAHAARWRSRSTTPSTTRPRSARRRELARERDRLRLLLEVNNALVSNLDRARAVQRHLELPAPRRRARLHEPRGLRRARGTPSTCGRSSSPARGSSRST